MERIGGRASARSIFFFFLSSFSSLRFSLVAARRAADFRQKSRLIKRDVTFPKAHFESGQSRGCLHKHLTTTGRQQDRGPARFIRAQRRANNNEPFSA